MCVDSLHNPQLSLFGSYSASEQFASTWRAPGAQTSAGAPGPAERELRHIWTQLLAKVTGRTGFQVQRSKHGKICRGSELCRTKVQWLCPALHRLLLWLMHPLFSREFLGSGEDSLYKFAASTG